MVGAQVGSQAQMEFQYLTCCVTLGKSPHLSESVSPPIIQGEKQLSQVRAVVRRPQRLTG